MAISGTVPVTLMGRSYRVTAPVQLTRADTAAPDRNSYSRIQAEGRAILYATDPTQDILVADTFIHVDIDGLYFQGGKRQLFLTTPNGFDGATARVNRSEFQRNNAAPMIQVSPKAPDIQVSANLWVNESRFQQPYTVFKGTYGLETQFSRSWVGLYYHPFFGTSAPNHALNAAQFENYDGLTFNSMYTIPSSDTSVALYGVRWVDNYYRFRAYNTRFGGEGGGHPIVFNYGVPQTVLPYNGGASVVIENSDLTIGRNTDPYQSIIRFVAGVPQTMRLVGNRGIAPGVAWITTDTASIPGGSLQAYLNSLPAAVQIQLQTAGNVSFPPLYTGGYPTELATDSHIRWNTVESGFGSLTRPAWTFAGRFTDGIYSESAGQIGVSGGMKVSGDVLSGVTTLTDIAADGQSQKSIEVGYSTETAGNSQLASIIVSNTQTLTDSLIGVFQGWNRYNNKPMASWDIRTGMTSIEDSALVARVPVGGVITERVRIGSHGITLGTAGDARINRHFKAPTLSATLDFPSIAAGSYAEMTVGMTSLTTSDLVQVAVPASIMALGDVDVKAYASSAQVATVRLVNRTGGTIDPPSTVFPLVYWQYNN